MTTTTTLDRLNQADAAGFTAALGGIYEHSPWIAARAAGRRPFTGLAALKLALQDVVDAATEDERLALIRAHPELAGKAAIAGRLTAESAGEQAGAGLDRCSPEEFERLQLLNADYNLRFGFPFILAVGGADGRGLARADIIATFARRLANRAADEKAENLRQIHRIAELRLNALLGIVPEMGRQIVDWAETIAAFSDEPGNLTCAYLTPAHRATAGQIAAWMREAGMLAHVDVLGNVVGRYVSDRPGAGTLITGSHFDTVRNGGKYDGREGVLLPIAVVGHLHKRGEKLPFNLEVIGFAEEEGVRFKSTFLGSSAVAGFFDPDWLALRDGDGVSMAQAIVSAAAETKPDTAVNTLAGGAADPAAARATGPLTAPESPAPAGVQTEAGEEARTAAEIEAMTDVMTPAQVMAAIGRLARDPQDVLGYVEVHIEQGPVLLQRGLPVGVVTSIAGSSRYLLALRGTASHSGTTPMNMRRDAAVAAAEILLYVERRAGQVEGLVGTVGQLQVPNGSINVIPGRCQLSLDVRAPDDATRQAAVADILAQVETICRRREVAVTIEEVMQAPAAPCAPWLMRQLEASTRRHGVDAFALPSGAGHDAMMMARLTDVAMLFTRCGNGGISHNPLETMTADDAELSASIFLDFLRNFQPRPPAGN